MKHAKQSIVFLSALGVVTSFYAHILAQPSDYSSNAVSDQITYITRGDFAPANNAAYTIARPGVYQLTSAKTASGVPNISITANNVTLDLGGNTLTGGTNGIEITGNNVTVKNGTITDMTQNGMLVQGAGCCVDNCDFVSCVTGITLQSSHQCVVEHCRVRNMTQAGVSLVASYTTIVSSCVIESVVGTGSVYGIYAHNGSENSLGGCTIKNIQTSSSTGSHKAVGIACEQELASNCFCNDIQGVESLTTVSAYGLWINGGDNARATNNKVTSVTTSNDRGQGVFVNQGSSYVANNLCYDCDASFTGVSAEYITSQANARGVYNIDTNLTTPDTVAVMHDDQLPTIESQLDLVSDNVFSADSKLDILAQCESTAVTAAGTLSIDYGLYCLAQNITGQLSITGTGIDLDLSGRFINANSGANGLVISGDDVSVHNGTVRNASASGVKITGNNCLLDKIVSYGNVTGFELSNADRNTLTNCSAINNTREGYLLGTSDYNSFSKCRAINTSNTAAIAAGIKTTGGVGNRFDTCDINGVSSVNNQAYGLLASNEQKSSIADCTAMNITGSMYTAGVALIGDYLVTPTVNDFVFVDDRFSRHIDWVNTPVGTYIAMDGHNTAPRNVIIFKFAPTATTSADALTTVTFSPALSSGGGAEWLSWQNKQYLAVTGLNGLGGDDVFVYDFSPATGTLTQVASYNHDASVTVANCDWALSDTCAYLFYTANATAGNNELVALRFNGSSLVKVSGLEVSPNPLGVRAHRYKGKIRIALSVFSPGGATQVKMYGFNDVHGSELLELLAATYGGVTGVMDSLAWFDFDGETYLELPGNGDGANSVRILKYTENPTSQLQAFALYSYGTTPNRSVIAMDALVTGTTVYVAVGGLQPGQFTKILTFDPYKESTTTRLSSYYDLSADTDLYTTGVTWNRCPMVDNKIFLVNGKELGSTSGICLHVYGFNLNNQSQLNLVSDITVSDVTGGSGILADTVINGAQDNRVYNCKQGLVEGIVTDYPGTPFDASNWQVPHA